MKFKTAIFSVLATISFSTQLAWSDGPKSYPRDYFETHQKSEPVGSEERNTASVDKHEDAPAKVDEVVDFHEGTGAQSKFFGSRFSRF